MAKAKPVISVVIPAFNEEENLPECLASLRGQDFSGGYEIIVVDNTSCDGTAEVALRYGARVISCDRKGVFFAREVGAAAACGDIIIQADADTIYSHNWLSRIMKHFAMHPEAVAVAGNFIYKTPPWWAGVERFLRNTANLLSVPLFKRPFVISGANFAFCKWAFLKIGGYATYAYSPDQYDISRRLSHVGKILYDNTLEVKTSSRSVEKPAFVILIDLFRHLGRYTWHNLDLLSGGLRASLPSLRLPRARTALMASPLFFLVIFCAYGYFVPAAPVFGKVYYRGDPTQKVIALTFDDGPNEPYTSQVLDVLDEYGIKATFFTVGENILAYPDVARRIVFDGHVLGNHSQTHRANHALTMEGCRDLTLAEDVITAAIDVSPNFYRPPHGKKTPWELQYLKEKGLKEVLWNISTSELSGKTPETIAQEIVSKARPGGIILLHDGYGTEHGTPRADKSATVEALPIIIKALHEKGYGFVTIAELLQTPAYH